MKYLSKENAIARLKGYTLARSDRLEGELLSPAESLLLDSIIMFSRYVGMAHVIKKDKQQYKELKFIATSLGLMRLIPDMEKSLDTRKRMGAAYGALQRVRRSSGRGHDFLILECKEDNPSVQDWKPNYENRI